MSILPFADVRYPIVHRAVAVLPPGGGNAATGRWQCCHRAVNDGKVFMNKRESLRLSMVITKFEKHITHKVGNLYLQGEFARLSLVINALAEHDKDYR